MCQILRRLQLLRVMSRLTQPGVRSLPYFMLCREFGVRAVDGMVRGRILDLRWMDPVTKEGPESQEGVSAQAGLDQPMPTSVVLVSVFTMSARSSSGHSDRKRLVEMDGMDGEPYTLVEQDLIHAQDEEEIFGPKVLPATPIMRYAMAGGLSRSTRTHAQFRNMLLFLIWRNIDFCHAHLTRPRTTQCNLLISSITRVEREPRTF
ncbi:hypothetical protein EDB84DRAFT_309807 [Lactarius hengduanensis]|nr:hypothetical protein EDB84DRAFT_309807 [Lactarius hengduanensis]